jgi:rubredoxin
MRIEIPLFFICAFIVANIYTDGRYMKLALSWKKYYQMGGVVLGFCFLYWLIKKNPSNARELIMSSNEYIKYLPIDKNTTNMINPILDFTSKYGGSTVVGAGAGAGVASAGEYYGHPVLQMKQPQKKKRIVSETKKKFVASSQNWLCANCKNQLDYTFEVDHTISLENGGTNDIHNLKALCPSCHRKKTAWENMI